MNADTAHASLWLRHAASSAREAAAVLARSGTQQRNAAVRSAAGHIRANAPAILAANEADLGASQATPAFRDRLTLTPERVEAMAAGLDHIAALADPLARTLAEWTRPNGLHIRRIPTPIGSSA